MYKKNLKINALRLALVALSMPVTAFATTYQYADPSNWTSLNTGSGPAIQSWKGANDLSVSVIQNPGADIGIGTSNISFSSSSPSNPDWIAGSRDFLNIAYDELFGAGEDGVAFRFDFSSALSSQDYLVFADFDFGEEIYIKAYDSGNNLISYNDFTFAQQNGNEIGGSTYTNINAVDFGSGFSLLLQSPSTDSANNPIVTLQSSTAISRLEYTFNMNSQGLSVGSNSVRVNFSTPIPEPSALSMLAMGLMSFFAVRRKK